MREIDRAEDAYRRGDQFEKRRKLMEAWAKFCLVSGSSIILLKKRVP